MRRCIGVAVTLALALQSSGYAGECASVARCVTLARRTPGQFSATLVPLMSGLSTDALLAGLDFADPKPALVGRVRAFALQSLYGHPLSDAQVDRLYAKYMAGPDELSELVRGPLTRTPRGKKLLVAYMMAHDDARALRVAWALAAEARVPAPELERARSLVWTRYLRERQTKTDEHDSLLNFMANQPKDFAALAQALVAAAILAKQPLVYDDLDLMSRQATIPVVEQLLAWSDSQPLAQTALLHSMQSAPDDVLKSIRGAKRAAFEAMLRRASLSTDANTRSYALSAWSRLYAPPLAPNSEVRTRFIELSADPDASVREAAYRSLTPWIDDAAVRAAVLSGAARWDWHAVTIVSHDPKGKLAPWRRAVLVSVLKSLPEKEWLDGTWQHELAFIGLQLERASGHKAGFDAFADEFVGRCGNDRLQVQVASADLELLDPAAYAAWLKTQPKPPSAEEQAKAARARAAKLRAARDKLLASLKS